KYNWKTKNIHVKSRTILIRVKSRLAAFHIRFSQKMNRLIQIINEGFVSIEMDLSKNPRWYIDSIPSEAGWYFIETTTPIDTLRKVGKPKEKGNYNIPQKIIDSQYLINSNLSIKQIGNQPYVVYSGEAANLMNRAREHSFGGKGTGCLAIEKYRSLCSYKWCFSYVTCRTYSPESGGDKGLRNLGEQIWRSQNGWPVLCSK
ncbi:MAG: hypothetical protein WAL93_17130, partial [Desulfobacterales bacterium]